jgi:hypothetical protein
MIESYRSNFFNLNPDVAGPVLNLPPPRQLPEAALDTFYASVQASLDHLSRTGTFNPVSVEQARVFLDQLRESVRTSTATSEELEMFSNVQESYERVMAQEEARRSGEHEPLLTEDRKTTSVDQKDDEDANKTVDLTSPESKSPDAKSPPHDPPADA